MRCIGSGGGGRRRDGEKRQFTSVSSALLLLFLLLDPRALIYPPPSPPLQPPSQGPYWTHISLQTFINLLSARDSGVEKNSEPLFVVPEEHRSKNFETCYLRNAGLRSVRVVVVLLGGQFVCSFHLNSLRGGIQFARPL